MNQHFGVAFYTLVELFICNLCLVNRNLVADHKGRLRFARDDQIAEVSVVLLDVALTGSQRESLSLSISTAPTYSLWLTHLFE